MAERRFVIVGNGAAGTTAAEELRKLDPSGRITLIGLEPYPLYNRVSLPRVLQGRLAPERTLLRTVEWHAQRGIDLRLETEAAALHVAERTLELSTGEALPWDALLIATGGRPRRLGVPGDDAPNVLHFQTLDDTRRLLEAAAEARARSGAEARAVVIGGSFIAYELTEGFVQQGLRVTWLMRGDRFLRRVLPPEAGELVDAIAGERGVEVVHNEEVARVVVRDGLAVAVETKSGRRYPCDLVGAGVGLEMYTAWLAGSPVPLEDGAVRTDERLSTGIEGVFAAGDVARFFDPIIGRRHRMGTWDNALMHGRVAARNMLGAGEVYREVPTYSSPLFDSNISVLGMTPEDHPGLEAVTRVDAAARTARTLFFLEGRLAGAVLIGAPRGRKRLLELVKSGEPVAAAEREALLKGE
ncbi:MAG: FAD-dependent oxidoreductase [Firmicutes bacterium]|nr:FAD-dependent oxidoreductase [Bacillota bacterium]MBE3590895.1 FAD-dependent oxidoreductase [Bacillota bacterium]